MEDKKLTIHSFIFMPKFPLRPSRSLSASGPSSHQKPVAWKAFLSALQAVRETTGLTLHRSPLRRAGWLTQQNSSSDQREASSGFHCVIPTRRRLPGTKARLKDDPDAHVFAEPKEESGTISEEHQASFLCPA